jgi:protein-L-isoaspartate(D-aspartate) O-methyltransferase
MADQGHRTAEDLNARLIETLLSDGSIKSPHVEAAFRTVLRHHFLPGTPLEEVYSARAVVTRRGPDGAPTSSSSDPKIMARMLEQLDVRPGHQVLEIGAATGYNAALLSHLTGEAGTVTTVDIDPILTATAVENLQRSGVHRVEVVTGDGWAGVPSTAPFDRIVATVGVWNLSPAWIDQLLPGGVLEVPLWLRAGLQASVAFQETEDGLRSRSIEPCAFMRLQGLGAGPESYTRVGRWTAHLDDSRPTDVARLSELLEGPARTQDAPSLDAGWFTAIALSAPGAVTLANWEERVTLSGLFDLAGGSLAVVESDCSGSEPRPRALHCHGAAGAVGRLIELIDETPPIGLDEVQIDVAPPDAVVDGAGVLARLSRPSSQFVISRSDRP